MLASALVASLAYAAPAPEPHLIDMMVAQVGPTVITLSELVAETRLALLVNGGPEAARAAQLPPELLEAVLRTLVTRELLVLESRRLRFPEPQGSEVEKALLRLSSRFPSPGDWERFLEKAGLVPLGADAAARAAPPALITRIRAELEASMFLELRTKSGVTVRESDLGLCYEANRAHFGERTLAEVKDAIRVRLLEQGEARVARTLVEQLEQKTPVRYGASFSAVPAELTPEPSWSDFRCPEPREKR